MDYPRVPEKCILDVGFEYRYFEGGCSVIYVKPKEGITKEDCILNNDLYYVGIQLEYFHQMDIIELERVELDGTSEIIFRGIVRNEDEFYKVLKELNIIE